jgi:hypothetical protein
MLRYTDYLLFFQIEKLKKENQELKEKLINLIINKNIISVDEFELLFKFSDYNNKTKIYPPLPLSPRSSFSEN